MVLPGRPNAAVAGKSRTPYWDNLRFVAIALVVIGHTITNFSSASTMTALYFVIYAFHMPLFAFVSGYFASAGPFTRDTAFATFRQLLAPYLVFSVIWFVLRLVVEGHARLDLGSPYQLMWFLVALAVWRTALPYLAALRYPVLISLGVAVIAGYFNSVGTAFESGKILGMLPFFVLGWAVRQRGWASDENLGRLASRGVRVAAVVVLVLALALSYLRVESIRDLKLRKWVRMGANYADLDVTEWWAGLVRLALLLLAVVLGLCVMSLVPRGRSLLSTWGRRTMYVYLLHLIPLYLLGQLTDAYEWFDSLPRFALAILLGTLWAVVLASGVVARVFRPLVEPRLEWLRARDLTVPAVSGAGGAAPGRLAAPTDR